MDNTNLNLSTLFANILDAIATAVAAKIPQPTIDITQIDKLVEEKVNSKVEAAINFTDLIDRVEQNVDVKKLAADVADSEAMINAIDTAVDSKVDVSIDNIDWTDKVGDALENLDLTDYLDISSTVEDAISDFDMTDKVKEVLENENLFDSGKFRAAVRDVVDDMDLSDHIDESAVADKVNDSAQNWMDNNFDISDYKREIEGFAGEVVREETQAAIKKALDTYTAGLPAMQQAVELDRVRTIVRKEVAEMLQQALGNMLS